MANQKKGNRPGKSRSGSVSASEKKKAAAQAKAEAERRENAEKSRRMGSIFLYVFLSIIAVFCLYTLIVLLFFSAKSVSELRSNYLLVSLFSIPFLIAAVAVVLRFLRKKPREEASAGVRTAENLVFFAALTAAMLLFILQFTGGRTDMASARVCTVVTEALEHSGSEVRELDEPYGNRTILEGLSYEHRYLCGSTSLVVNYHAAGSGVTARFLKQARQDYADFTETDWTQDGLEYTLWPGEQERPGTIAALCIRSDRAVLILELVGPEEQVKVLLPLLQEAGGKILGG